MTLNVLKCMKQTILESVATHRKRWHFPLLWQKYVYHNPAKNTSCKFPPLYLVVKWLPVQVRALWPYTQVQLYRYCTTQRCTGTNARTNITSTSIWPHICTFGGNLGKCIALNVFFFSLHFFSCLIYR